MQDVDQTTPKGEASDYPPAARGWAVVCLLMFAYIFSYLDRSIIGYLATPIKEDLGITDEQFGWLTGLAFAVFYGTAAIPLGWLVDRWKRTKIIAAGITLWSVATIASGFATKFWHLFLARVGVGAGEATLSPAAFSIIGDSFPPEKRGKPIAFYTMALIVGGALSGYIIAFTLRVTDGLEVVHIPLLGDFAPWQAIFIIIGTPSLLLALVFFLIKEPPRQISAPSGAETQGNGFLDTLKLLGRNWGTYASFVSLICVMTIIAYSQAFFLPSVFERVYGWSGEFYAFANATGTLVLGVPVYLATGFLSDYFSKRGNPGAPFLILLAGFLLMTPAGAIAFVMPNGWLAFIILMINSIGIMIVSAVGVTALLNITPARVRGQVVAIYYMIISLAGLLLGPSTVGSLSTRLFGEENLNFAVAAVPAIYGIIPLLMLPIIRKLYLQQMARLAGQNT